MQGVKKTRTDPRLLDCGRPHPVSEERVPHGKARAFQTVQTAPLAIQWCGDVSRMCLISYLGDANADTDVDVDVDVDVDCMCIESSYVESSILRHARHLIT